MKDCIKLGGKYSDKYGNVFLITKDLRGLGYRDCDAFIGECINNNISYYHGNTRVFNKYGNFGHTPNHFSLIKEI